MALIEAKQVIKIAFNRNISETKIMDSVIKAAELRYIKPILGSDLYDAICASPSSSTYAGLLPLIQQALAWWTKYLVLPEIYLEISDLGVNTLNAQNAQTVSDQRLIEARAQVAEIAREHALNITSYLNDNDIPDYSAGKDPNNAALIAGGIIFDTDITAEADEDDGPEVWRQGRWTRGMSY